MGSFEPDTGLVVNTGTGTVHKPDCDALVPGSPWTSAWKGVAISGSDKPCGRCKPDLVAARAVNDGSWHYNHNLITSVWHPAGQPCTVPRGCTCKDGTPL